MIAGPLYFGHILVNSHPGRQYHSLTECWLPASAVTESLKVHSTIVSGQLLLGGEVYGKTTIPSTYPLLHFIFCEMSSFVRSNVVWDTMAVNKAIRNGKILILA